MVGDSRFRRLARYAFFCQHNILYSGRELCSHHVFTARYDRQFSSAARFRSFAAAVFLRRKGRQNALRVAACRYRRARACGLCYVLLLPVPGYPFRR